MCVLSKKCMRNLRSSIDGNVIFQIAADNSSEVDYAINYIKKLNWNIDIESIEQFVNDCVSPIISVSNGIGGRHVEVLDMHDGKQQVFERK